MEERQNDLEIRLAYMEDYIAQLNEVVLESNKRIEVLETKSESMKRKIEELAENLPAPENRKPPHY